VGWIRAGFIVLFLFGGLALPLYLAGWLLMPSAGEQESIAGRFIGGLGGDAAKWLGIGLIFVAGAVLLSSTGFIRGGWIWAGALLVIGVLLYRGDLDVDSKPRTPPPSDVSTPPAPGPLTPDDEWSSTQDLDPYSDEAVASYAATPYEPPYPTAQTVMAPPPPPPPPRPRSILGRLTFAAVLVTLGVMALLDNLDVTQPAARHYIAAVFAVLGVALVIGTWWGRVRGAIIVGLLLIPPLFFTTLVDIPLEGEVGEARYSPATIAEIENPYEMAIGDLRIDASALETDAEIAADLGIGLLWVTVPADADVVVNGDIGIGELDLLGLSRGGLGLERTVSSGGSGPEMVLDLEVGIGELRVTRALNDWRGTE
jgi:hypothetical protein